MFQLGWHVTSWHFLIEVYNHMSNFETIYLINNNYNFLCYNVTSFKFSVWYLKGGDRSSFCLALFSPLLPVFIQMWITYCKIRYSLYLCFNKFGNYGCPHFLHIIVSGNPFSMCQKSDSLCIYVTRVLLHNHMSQQNRTSTHK